MKKRRTPAAALNRAKPTAVVKTAPSRRLLIALALGLALITLAIYAQTATHGYIAYDDDQYVYQNPHVQAGLTAANAAWAFTTFFYANWHPLTWISYLADTSLFGPHPGPQHLENVFFHIASTLLLFWALVRMTGRVWRSAVVAALFAVHPLRVESVDWISERKDVLSTFGEMATLGLYLRYAARPKFTTYLPLAAAFALSLLAKPMAVTFPLVLLLLDYWPLGRMAWPPAPARLRQLFLEKTPLLALSAIAAALTFAAQRSGGAVVSLAKLPFAVRAANAAIGYAAYLGKIFWPADLAVLYPAHLPDSGAAWLAAALLAAITFVAWRWAGSRPYFVVGWLWYLGMLVPVIGLVQVGVQSMADRYTYLPSVGLAIALVWLVADAVEGRRAWQMAAGGAAAVAIALLAVAAFRQAACWKDSQTLFEHTLAVTRNNHIIENNLGVIYGKAKRDADAMALYRAAIATAPDYAQAHANLAHELLKAGQFGEAQQHLDRALEIDPGVAEAHGDTGVLLAARGQFQDALREIERALALAPQDADNESNLCYVLTHMGRPQEAIAHCQQALRIDPHHANAKFNLDHAQAVLSGQEK